jgi:hypothetical protein
MNGCGGVDSLSTRLLHVERWRSIPVVSPYTQAALKSKRVLCRDSGFGVGDRGGTQIHLHTMRNVKHDLLKEFRPKCRIHSLIVKPTMAVRPFQIGEPSVPS